MNGRFKLLFSFALCIMLLFPNAIHIYAADQNSVSNPGLQSVQPVPSIDTIKTGQALQKSSAIGTPNFELKNLPSKKSDELRSRSLKIPSFAGKAQNMDSAAYSSATGTVTQSVYDNTDPNNAIFVNFNTVIADTINAEGEQQWYFLQPASSGKMTVYMQTVSNADIDYDLYLYKLDQTSMSLNLISYSAYGAAMDEQLSAIVDPGYYFICVESASGFDTSNPFAFISTLTDVYDSSEPDDNIMMSKEKSLPFTAQQTLDNDFDADWITVTLNQEKIMNLQFNVPANVKYNVDVFGPTFSGTLGSGGNFAANYSFPAGTYYFRVRSESGYDKANGYTFKVTPGIANAAGTLISKDGKYIFQIDSSSNMYINGASIGYDWEREYYFTNSGSYTYRSQEIWRRDDTVLSGASFGSYSSSSTGSIPRALSISASNLGYFYWYTYYVSGAGIVAHDELNTTLDFPVNLIINLDTNKVVDLDSDINFYYGNQIESRRFVAQ